MPELRCEPCEHRFAQLGPGSLDAIITDKPFNVSERVKEKELSGFEDHVPFKRDLGEWDKGFGLLDFVIMAERVVRPGGWLIVKSGDTDFGMTRLFAERNQKEIVRHLDFLQVYGRLGPIAATTVQTYFSSQIPAWEYWCTVAWHKVNPQPYARESKPVSSCEWLQVLKRLDEKGRSVPGTFNWLGQSDMHNFIEGPLGLEERLYWHVLNGAILTCPDKRKCNLCAVEVKRLSHPTQTPLYVWRWVMRRFTKPGDVVYDPFAGVGTTVMANLQGGFDLKLFASEKDEIFAEAHRMWRNGEWHMPPLPEGAVQEEMF